MYLKRLGPVQSSGRRGLNVPEGDTIYRSARALGRALKGKTVTRFESSYALLTQANDQTSFAGQTVTQVESRGKWLLIHFSGGAILATRPFSPGRGSCLVQPRAMLSRFFPPPRPLLLFLLFSKGGRYCFPVVARESVNQRD